MIPHQSWNGHPPTNRQGRNLTRTSTTAADLTTRDERRPPVTTVSRVAILVLPALPGLTNDGFGERPVLQGCQTEVADLDLAGGARYEDIVTLQIPVDDGRVSGVEELETFQDLPTPRADDLRGYLLLAKVLQIPENGSFVTGWQNGLPYLSIRASHSPTRYPVAKTGNIACTCRCFNPDTSHTIHATTNKNCGHNQTGKFYQSNTTIHHFQ